MEPLFILETNIEKPSTLVTLFIKESPNRLEISRRALHKWRCTPRKIANGIATIKTDELVREYKKYTLEFKQRAVYMVCSGQCVNQVSKIHNINYNTLKNWKKRAFAPNLPYNSTAAWLYIKKA